MSNGFTVRGKVRELETRVGLSGLIIEALDKDFKFDDRLGSVITGKDGEFEIKYEEKDYKETYLEKKPAIYLRIKSPDGKVIHTTEDKVRYKADKTEEFVIDLPREVVEKERKEIDYQIEGKIDPTILKEIPEGLTVRIYAVRDRKVLGSSEIGKNGSFSINYKYGIYEKRKKRLAIGTSLIIGPDLPEDTILNEKFLRVFLPAEAFEEMAGKMYSTVPEKILKEPFSKRVVDKVLVPWFKVHCYEWRPCVQVLACSKIESGLCYNEQPLINVHVRIYEVRWPLIVPSGTTPAKYTVLVAEGETDQFGYFKTTITRCTRGNLLLPFYKKLGCIVEVGQVIDGMFNSIYKDPDDQLRELESDLCEEIYIEKWKVVTPEIPDELMTGNTFKLTRIGNIPVGYINQNSSSPNYGYANSIAATDSATLKVVDSAFYGSIKLYANIGAGIVNTVKYYRIKYSYESDGVTLVNYVQVPFKNLRESTDAEKATYGPYKTEFMGPIDGNVYTYPNPYDTAVDKQWVYKGLVTVLNTAGLPLGYGKYTFTIEPLDVNKNTVEVDSEEDLTCTLLVDNTAPMGSIGDIMGPGGQLVSACGFLKLPFARTDSRTCDSTSYTRGIVHGKVSVPFAAQDWHGNLDRIVLAAHFGDSRCDAPVILVGTGKKPGIGCDGALEYQNYNDVPLVQRPSWGGRGDYCASSEQDWDECAYEFRLTVYKRLTNGEVAYPWWTFTKHITIIRFGP